MALPPNCDDAVDALLGPQFNKTILQGFEWYSNGTTTSLACDSSGVVKDLSTSHWSLLRSLLSEIKALGVTSIWIPPACKSTGPNDNGYGIYDLYDLGEFDTKGGKATKWGSKEELLAFCADAKRLEVGIIFDAVLNHKAAADGSEEAAAIKVNPKDRTKDLEKRPKTIESWTRFSFNARSNKYSSMKYNKAHFSGIDWDSKAKEKGIFKFVGTRPDGTKKDWAKDVAKNENGNYDYLMFADVDFDHEEVREDILCWGRWLTDELPGLTGFRLDAIKHYSARFQNDFLNHVQEYARQRDKSLFFVGEYWSANSKTLSSRIDTTFSGNIHLFDVKLMYNFHDYSIGQLRDLRKIFRHTLVELNPRRAVTFVTNHDTQESQSLAAPVQPWFIPHAYALILLRQEGNPCVFWGDVYGTQGPQPRLPACGGRLARLMKARSLFAGGSQVDYFSTKRSANSVQDDPSCIAWNRKWWSSAAGGIGLAVVLSISWSWKKRRLNVGSDCAGQIWTDIMGWAWSGVLIDKDGFGDFPVGPRTISVWTWQNAPGRDEVDTLVYPSEFPTDEISDADACENAEDTGSGEERTST